MLQLSSSTLDLMQDGLTTQAAQDICELLLPSTAAIAVAITDTEQVLGYAGFQEADNPVGSDIRTQATHDTIADGSIRVLYCSEDIGFPRTRPPSRRPSSSPSRWATRSRDAEVLLSQREEDHRDAEVDRAGLRQAPVHADGGDRDGAAAQARHIHGAEDAPKPDQPALPL